MRQAYLRTHPKCFYLKNPRFWESRDQPTPGSFPKKDPGYEVDTSEFCPEFCLLRFNPDICQPLAVNVYRVKSRECGELPCWKETRIHVKNSTNTFK